MSQPTTDPSAIAPRASADAIKAAVQEHYGSRITAAAGCCGPTAAGCCEPSTELLLHGPEALASLPEGVVTTSYGCGNPLALASLRPGEVVLDLGSGGGLEVLLAAQRVGATGFVYGLDMTDAMLEVARRNTAKAGATNVAFLKGDIEAIPLPDQSVDVIISNCVINLAPDKGQVLSDAFRVLRPGGRLAVSDIVFDGELDDLPVAEAEVRAALSWASCFAGALTMGAYRSLLEAAGFEQIALEVTRRYSAADLRGEDEHTAALTAEAVAALEGRVASCAISARRPALPIERATPADLPAVLELLTASNLPHDGLAEQFNAALVARDAGAVVGSAALELYGEAALLRSVAVAPHLRGQGLGRALTTAALSLARAHGVRQVYLLTTTAEGYFPSLGFTPTTRAAVAPAVQASAEFTGACPDSAAVMVHTLDG